MGQHYRVTVSSKRQMTLPAELCAELGIGQGTMLDVSKDDDGTIRLRRRRSISETAGSWSRILGHGPAPLSREEVRRINDDDAVERDERSRGKAAP
jgi:AbrB family looped-hinge helix DNA binding protein